MQSTFQRKVMRAMQSNRAARRSLQAAKARQARGRALTMTRYVPPTRMATKGEFKCYDYSQTAIGIHSTGDVQVINTIAQGTGVDEILGREYIIKSIQLQGYAYSTADTGIRNFARILLVWDKDPNGTTADPGDILNDINSGGAEALSMRNLNNRKRFIILRDWKMVLESEVDNNINAMNYFEYYKKHNFPVTCLRTPTGSAADIKNGALLLCTLGTVASGITDALCDVKVRIRMRETQ